jgi:hypothetical protein
MNRRRFESLAWGGGIAKESWAVGRPIASARDFTFRVTLCATAGGGGLVAIRAGGVRRGTDLAVATTGADRALVAPACGTEDCVTCTELVDGGVFAAATGAGSGASLAGALTGGRSGPDPPAAAGALPSPSAPIAAPTRRPVNRAVIPPPGRNCGRSSVTALSQSRGLSKS